jgi:hypothetical protein
MMLQQLLPCLVLLITAITIGTSVYAGPARWLTPTSLAALILAAIFGVRPLMSRDPVDFNFHGLDASGGLMQAEIVGLLSSAALLAGGLWASRSTNCQRSQPSAADYAAAIPQGKPSLLRVPVLGIAGAAGWLLSVAAFAGPSTLALLVAGRSSELSSRLAGYPTVLFTLALLGSGAACVYIARFGRGRKLGHVEMTALTVAVAISAGCVSLDGTRRFLLPALLSPVVARVFSNGGRLPRRTLPAAGLVLIFLMTLPFVRSAGARQDGENLVTASARYYATGGLNETLKAFFLSYDTEMLNYVAFASPRLGHTIPYGLGRGTVGEFLLFPLPSGVFGEQLYSDRLLTDIFGGSCSQVDCPVASEPGVLLLDFGFPGVFLGMLGSGFLLRRLELRAAARGSPERSVLVIAAVGGYAPVLMRTNTIDAAWWTLYFLLAMQLAAHTMSPRPRRLARPIAEVMHQSHAPVQRASTAGHTIKPHCKPEITSKQGSL